MNIKKAEELKGELANLKETDLPQEVIKEKLQEFLNAFEDYFRERGFVIRKKDQSVRAAYETLHFKAFINESRDLFIMKGKEQLASITVKFKGSRKSGDLINPRESLEELIGIKFDNPVFYCSGSNFGHAFESTMLVLDSIFNA